MIRTMFFILLFFQTSFAMDSLIDEALKCIEKKKMDVHSIERINGKIYAISWLVPANHKSCEYKTDYGTMVFEYKRNCIFEKKNWLKNVNNLKRKGLLAAVQNNNEDSVIVSDKDKVLWSCPLKTDDILVFQFLDKNRLMVSFEDGGNGEGDSIGVLNNKCQWTLFERKARLPYMYSSTFSSQFLHYEIMRKPYIVFYDSLYNKHWGTSSLFYIYVSTRTIACGYDDGANSSKALIKCIEWTGDHFVEKTLPHKVDIPDSEDCLCACSWTERLFPCGDGICVQNYETKKIEILIDE